MAPFRAKIGGKRIRKGENKNSFHSVPIRRGIEIAKKKAKKLKNTVMATFQAKIVLKRATKGEKKNYRFVQFLPDRLQKIPKKKGKEFKK